jgi:DTW domain-containing protein YfiP
MANAEVKITDEDIQAYITENKEYLPANTNTAEVKESIRKQLENTAQTEAFEKWFTELQKRSNVVIR